MAVPQTIHKAMPACFLDVPGTESAAALSVVSFEATELMGEPNTVRIVLTHPLQLARADYLNRDAAFTIVPADGPPRKFSGYIERFSSIQTTHDFTKYEVVLKSHFGRLAAVTRSRIFQHMSTPEIIAEVIRGHDVRDYLVRFRLRRRYPQHLFRMQHGMTDLAYVQMLMQKAGIYSYIVETEHGDYSLFVGGALVKQGVMDETGLIQVDHHPTTQQYTLKLANGASYAIPVAEQYRGSVDNGALANSGFQFYEGKHDTHARVIDRAEHRADYNEMLNPDRDDRP